MEVADTGNGMRRPLRVWRNLEVPRATWELGAYYASRPLGWFLPRGDGHGVLTLPGFMATDISTAPLRAFLRRLGYDARAPRLGRNLGPTDLVVDGLPRRLRELHASTGRPVSLIGVSLGGVFARDLARHHPDLVRQVITLASPFRLPVRYTGPDLTHASRLYRFFQSRHSPRAKHRRDEDDLPPLTVPRTAIYTRSDGVVPWQSCLEPDCPTAESIEVWGSHSGLGHNPLALAVIADRLAQPEGAWQPFPRQWIGPSRLRRAPAPRAHRD
jgi:pimeloyl-ACP methyl ester carboxylesterase